MDKLAGEASTAAGGEGRSGCAKAGTAAARRLALNRGAGTVGVEDRKDRQIRFRRRQVMQLIHGRVDARHRRQLLPQHPTQLLRLRIHLCDLFHHLDTSSVSDPQISGNHVPEHTECTPVVIFKLFHPEDLCFLRGDRSGRLDMGRAELHAMAATLRPPLASWR